MTVPSRSLGTLGGCLGGVNPKLVLKVSLEAIFLIFYFLRPIFFDTFGNVAGSHSGCAGLGRLWGVLMDTDLR